ncbi:MAG: glutamine amidotransferase [Polyangiaceae bacterium]
MPTSHLSFAADLAPWAAVLLGVLVITNLAFLAFEMRRRERGGAAIALSGVLASFALALAVLRPVRITATESVVGPKVVVLTDVSRSMALPNDGSPTSGKGERRRDARDRATKALVERASTVRFATFGFGEGLPKPFSLREASAEKTSTDDTGGTGASVRGAHSDLGGALRALAKSAEERPAAVVVVSDGRLDDPGEGADAASLRSLADVLRVPVHTVATTDVTPKDASVLRVAAAGAAVAHVPLPLRVDVACSKDMRCDDLTVTAKELREDGAPALLASGIAHPKDGRGTLDLTVTLERAGSRIVEVAIASPEGDTIPENDRRFVTFDVARERVRVLHVAGRPTNDVRALRQWLKSDASVDVVAFFILRTPADNPAATERDLALIPFPVDELFSDHLPSFDAVVLQDFDAQPYGLERHLPALARYVRAGGGLIMVGGPNSFVAGGYAGTPLGEVLPVTMDGSAGATAADTASFVPVPTAEGKVAPLLGLLRAAVGDELPSMPGANVLGDARAGASVLWTHPTRTTRTGKPMPVLAIGDQGDGRSIALGADGGWLLQFSALGARTAGRGHGALWDGLLGWLMRDPRFEPAKIELPSGCTADVPLTLRVARSASGAAPERVVVDVTRLDTKSKPVRVEASTPARRPDESLGASTTDVVVGPLPAGGYSARVSVGDGPSSRRDFACEVGGDEWADSAPDPGRLEAIASATGGMAKRASDDLSTIPFPKPTVVSAERHVAPLAPPWVFTLLASLLLGCHWFVRRRSGLA